MAYTLLYFSAGHLSFLPGNASDMFDKKKVRVPVLEYCCSIFLLPDRGMNGWNMDVGNDIGLKIQLTLM